jgi:hypothetical protein
MTINKGGLLRVLQLDVANAVSNGSNQRRYDMNGRSQMQEV